jgi:dolichyl-phosphate-mannose-protein mannosyltransferase
MSTQTQEGTDDTVVRGTRAERHRRRHWYDRPLLVILAVTALGGGLRFWHLSSPHAYVFDEVYYAKDACFDAGFDYVKCGLASPGEQTVGVHPPLGRLIIAEGVKLFSKPGDFACEFGTYRPGCKPFGFRVTAAAFGTISVLLAAILGWQLFGSALWAGAAGLLLATESLNFVQSRVAMLDIFLVTFVLAGFLFLVLDRAWIERRMATHPDAATADADPEADLGLDLPPDRPPSPILRPWRIAAGLAFGAAAATKWSGAPALLGAIVLAFAWERTRRKELGLPSPFRDVLVEESFGIFVFLIVLPLAVYVASYAKWFADHQGNLSDWWALQRNMASYSIHLRASHPYASRPWTWLYMGRPVSYYYQGAGTRAAAILAIGNPAIFWGTFITMPYALFCWIRKPDWRAGLLVVAFAVQYFPWFLAARTDFLFYIAPATPFMVLAAVYLLRDVSEIRVGVERSRAYAPIAAFLVLIAIGLFAFFFPILTGRNISYAAWRARMWFPGWI